jgi:CDP-diacylglycerol--serine O-phosphatidyltransferase
MISRVPMYSFKKMRVSRRAVVPILVAGGLVVMLGVRDFWLLMVVLALLYLATVLLSWPSHRRILKKPVAEIAGGVGDKGTR